MSPTGLEPRARHDQAGLLSDKVVVITEGSTGIGAAAARLFAREGAAVVVGARSGAPAPAHRRAPERRHRGL
jgi:NAD(P)-dependent dehydrogenase (short-subunit alcohol dehydrogenase family)